MSTASHEPVEPPLEAPLRDGTRASIRPVTGEDAWRLREGLALLSPRSRYLRFHSTSNQLSRSQLQYLTEIGHPQGASGLSPRG